MSLVPTAKVSQLSEAMVSQQPMAKVSWSPLKGYRQVARHKCMAYMLLELVGGWKSRVSGYTTVMLETETSSGHMSHLVTPSCSYFIREIEICWHA